MTTTTDRYQTGTDKIPPITEPLGRYWEQPKREGLKFDNQDKTVSMSKLDFERLMEYSATIPSGKYEGKMWKATNEKDWFLMWYGAHSEPNMLSIQRYKIIVQ